MMIRYIFLLILFFGGKLVIFTIVFCIRIQFSASVQYSVSEEDYSEYVSGEIDDLEQQENEELSAAELGVIPEFITNDSGKARSFKVMFK